MSINPIAGKINPLGESIRRHKLQIVAMLVFLLSYIPTFCWMWDRWFVRDSYYSHGVLVPFVTIFFIWKKRHELRDIAPQPSRWAIGVIALGIGLNLISAVLRIYFTAGFSMLFVLVGFVLYFYGEKTLSKIWFPILFLIFMIPVPLALISEVSFMMKILAAKLTVIFLNQVGFASVRDGSVIMMKHTHVIVEDICSGLRSLISLTALGSIFAYLMKSSLTKRIILFLSTIPIAIITNVIRISFLSIVSEIWGAQYATGLIHDLSGFIVFISAFILLFTVEKLLA